MERNSSIPFGPTGTMISPQPGALKGLLLKPRQTPRNNSQEPTPKFQGSRLKTQDPRPKPQDPRLKTQDPSPKTPSRFSFGSNPEIPANWDDAIETLE